MAASKYTPSVVKKLTDLIAEGKHTLRDCWEMCGIAHETYYEWQRSHPEFSEAIKKAKQDQLDSYKEMAKSGLAKLLDVYEYEEEHTETVTYPNGKTKDSSKTVKKKIMPNPVAIIFTLTNRDPEKWKRNDSAVSEGKFEPPPPMVFKVEKRKK